MRIRHLMLAALVACSVGIGAAQGRSPEVLFKAAQTRELVDGDWKGAAAMYLKIADEAKTNRPLAARALLAAGALYQSLGTGEARGVFERIVREYGDQSEASATARSRLTSLGASTTKPQNDDSTPRRVLTLPDSDSWSYVDADGTIFVVNGGVGRETVIRDVSTNAVIFRIPATNFGFARFAFSPDRRSIAYQSYERLNERVTTSLKVARLDPGATARTLIASDQRQFVEIVGWSRDTRSILVVSRPAGAASSTPGSGSIGSHVAWVSAADGAVRLVTSLPYIVHGACLSPDGNLVAFVMPSPTSTSFETRIGILDLSTGEVSDVVKIAGLNGSAMWTPDGSHLVFTSDRAGTVGLWAVALQGGKAAGDPFLVKRDFPQRRVGISSSGSLYYEPIGSGDSRVNFIAERGPNGSARVIQTLPGAAIGWSPNGKWLSFGRPSKRAREMDLILRSVDTGEEHLVQRDGLDFHAPRWLPNASAVLTRIGRLNDPNAMMCYVEVATRQFTNCFPKSTQDRIRGPITFTSDGRRYYTWGRVGVDGPITELHTVDATTGVTVETASLPLAFSPTGGVVGIALSPDGQRLVILDYPGTRRDRGRLGTIRVDGTDYRELLSSVPVDSVADLVRWTPDGQDILYGTNESNGVWRIMRIPAAGGTPEIEVDPAKLTGAVNFPTQENVNNLVISPDGRHLAWDGWTKRSNEVWAVDNIMSLLSTKH